MSCPALNLEVLPCKIGVPSLVYSLPSHRSKVNLSLGAFGHLEKVAIMYVWLVFFTFGVFYHVLLRKWRLYLRVYTYHYGVMHGGNQQHTGETNTRLGKTTQ